MTSPTMSEARRYQQLRAHLGYLKLNDAAEALPRVLDAARTEGLSLTSALERLLDIEVGATEARKLAGRLRFASLPEPWTLELSGVADLVDVVGPVRDVDDAVAIVGSGLDCFCGGEGPL